MMTQRVVRAYPGGRGPSVATFDQSVATGFVELWGLPREIAAQRDRGPARSRPGEIADGGTPRG
jgi:hypothetical protein